ncbi:MAG: hypothetical protein M3325_13200 [Actinomycetota bacterium]|nr:hypothetical protein [Actinomycetota bacterium]MDQ3905385.1 hypothetical protein [Actinomycetota bacterium]
MSVPLQPSPLRGGTGGLTFALGLVAAVGVVVYAAWLAIAAVTAMGTAAQHVSGTVVGALHRDGSAHHSTGARPATAPPATVLPAPTPAGSTLAFDQLWISRNGDTIVAGAPTVGISAVTGESMIQVPVTLTNNGERDWNPASTGFVGTLDQAPVAESTDGDWMYRAPIAPHTSVTLTKVFLGKPGQFNLKVNTADGVASFAGAV